MGLFRDILIIPKALSVFDILYINIRFVGFINIINHLFVKILLKNGFE
jgi:hypothetical protein